MTDDTPTPRISTATQTAEVNHRLACDLADRLRNAARSARMEQAMELRRVARRVSHCAGLFLLWIEPGVEVTIEQKGADLRAWREAREEAAAMGVR